MIPDTILLATPNLYGKRCCVCDQSLAKEDFYDMGVVAARKHPDGIVLCCRKHFYADPVKANRMLRAALSDASGEESELKNE